MSHRYEGRSVVCPKCKKVGKLVRRTRSHVRRCTIKGGTYWQVRHGDNYCYIGTSLTSSLIKQLRREQREN